MELLDSLWLLRFKINNKKNENDKEIIHNKFRLDCIDKFNLILRRARFIILLLFIFIVQYMPVTMRDNN